LKGAEGQQIRLRDKFKLDLLPLHYTAITYRSKTINPPLCVHTTSGKAMMEEKLSQDQELRAKKNGRLPGLP
jgi:hypothetical protein